MKKKFIKQIGIEIEGEFSDDLASKLSVYGEIHSDGSIRRCRDYKDRKASYCNDLWLEEFSSKPFKYPDELQTLIKIFNLMEIHRIKKQFHWNRSCGFHIHISFPKSIAAEIQSIQFLKFFIENLKNKFPGVILRRASNSFCRILPMDSEREMADSEKAIAYEDVKYWAINFLAALNEHGTFEFRIFPSTTPLKMKEFLRFTIKMIEKFLDNSEVLLKTNLEIELEDKDTDAEFTEEVINKTFIESFEAENVSIRPLAGRNIPSPYEEHPF